MNTRPCGCRSASGVRHDVRCLYCAGTGRLPIGQAWYRGPEGNPAGPVVWGTVAGDDDGDWEPVPLASQWSLRHALREAERWAVEAGRIYYVADASTQQVFWLVPPEWSGAPASHHAT
jgi:hypothetical protein